MDKITLSIACSIDGYVNDLSKKRLILSSEADLQYIQRERARHDAILVGAGTVRSDNPTPTVRDQKLVQVRIRQGKRPQPCKVTITVTGDLDPSAKFFQRHGAEKIILCPTAIAAELARRFHGLATVHSVNDTLDAGDIIQTLETVGIDSLFVEGGTKVPSMFLDAGVFANFRLAIAPLFVGERDVPRFPAPAGIAAEHRTRLAVTRVRLLGDTTVFNYAQRKSTNAKCASFPDRQPNSAFLLHSQSAQRDSSNAIG